MKATGACFGYPKVSPDCLHQPLLAQCQVHAYKGWGCLAAIWINLGYCEPSLHWLGTNLAFGKLSDGNGQVHVS